ncbi:MAG: secretin and TonB N-terminal domain-containing protein [Candidatus Omnitrophica bacterium]|nr:secretin and TonB N-terminal domain-containing protein [Candidatus Omnitrophota bacterium]
MKAKKFLELFLIFNFTFLIFNYTAVAENSQGYAQAESPPTDLFADQTTNEQTNQHTGKPAYRQTSEPTELVTLDYKDAELSSVLRALSYSYNLNLVATKDIKGKVTVVLRDVTVDEALNAVLNVNGYTFTRKGNLIYITPGPGLEGIDVVTVTIALNYLTASEASELLQKVISSKGDIRINEATNSLVITDFPASIEKVKLVLKDIDIPPIQVLIEAKLVDITEKDYQNFGVTYTVDYKPAGDIKGLFDRKTGYQEELAGSQAMSGPSSTLSGGQLKITTFTFKGLSGTVTLDALIQDQKAHLLASPSIATLSGKEARIIIGERYPYKEKTQTTTGTTETTKFVDIGTTLRVTPQVSPDGWITMNVHPEVSSLTSSLDAGPRIATREADATIRVRDGETIIIGGLIKRQDDRVKGRIPIIGHIPILGWFFNKASSDLTSTELVVFITPRIIRTPEEMKAIEATRQKEVMVNIEGTGERVVVNQLWGEARDLEKDEGLVSRRKDKETRMSEALDRYKQIAKQFPGSEKADDALFRAGLIAYDYFADLDLAKNLFSQLPQTYPDSPYKVKSKRMVEHINKKLAALEKKKTPQTSIPEQKKVAPQRPKSKDKEITGNKGIIQGGR